MTASPAMTKQGALHGVRVLDLTRFYSGPFSTLMLAGFGAEVIRIDGPEQCDPTMTGPPFLGKDGVSFESPARQRSWYRLSQAMPRQKVDHAEHASAGRAMELFHSLLRQSDILVENWRPGAGRTTWSRL